MTGAPDTWTRMQEAFAAALACGPGEAREQALGRALGDAPELLNEVRGMLAAHDAAQPLALERRLVQDAPAPPESVGPYRILGLLGRGGMGEVYAAERQDPRFPQRVALKILLTGWNSPEFRARFHLEQQILTRLDHPNIAQLLDAGITSDGRPYLVLQYVEGRPITEYCAAHGLDIRGRLALFLDVIRAVGHAHRNLVVHRDLKPCNILVTAEGRVRLLDFGIAKLLDPPPGAPLLTRPDVHLMTPEYASPEQIRGDAVTTATDVHGLGILLYELLTGRNPFQAGQPVAAVRSAILESDPPPPSQVAGQPALRGDLDAIVLKALRKEPLERFSSVQQMGDDVERYLNGEPVVARQPSLAYRCGKFVGRHRIACTLAALSLLLLVALTAALSYQSHRIARERDLARTQQKRTERLAGFLINLMLASTPRQLSDGRVLTVAGILRRSERSLYEAQGLDAETPAAYHHMVGRTQLARGQCGPARQRLDTALAEYRSGPERDEAAMADVQHDMARLAADCETPAKAVAALRESLNRLRRLHGDAHEKTAAAMHDLAAALPFNAERLQLEQAALARSPEPGLNRAAVLAGLGRYYFETRAAQQSARYYQEALALYQRLLPPGHPATLDAMSSLAFAFTLGRNPEQAAALHARVAELTAAYQGKQSVPAALALSNYAAALTSLRHYAEAEAAARESHRLLRELFGERHPYTPNAARTLGMILQLEGRHADALAVLRQAAAAQKELARDADHSELAAIELRIAVLQIRTGRYAEGAAALRAIVEKLRKIHPQGQATLAEGEILLGFALLEHNQAAAAEAQFRSSLGWLRGHVEPSSPRLAEAECGLGAALARQGRQAEARALLERAFPAYRASGWSDPVEVERVRVWATPLS